MDREDLMEYCKGNIEQQLKNKGFEHGWYQSKWRDFGEHQDIEFDYFDCELAILDALIYQGGIAAWAGDGVGCVTQMLELAYARRDYWRKRALDAEAKLNEYICS